jgi:SAM-dependent methyltransferase
MPNLADRIIDLYERHASAYIADRGNRLHVEQYWLDRFIGLLPQNAAVLDIGCGSGEPIARHLIERGIRISGIDSSRTLIAHCRERFPDQQWRVADMRGLALEECFHGLLAWDSFFHLTTDDQRRMFPIFKRHAAHGATLMFTSGPAQGDAIGTYQGEPLYHSSLAPEEYRSLLEANGFRVVANVFDDPDCGGHSVWLAQTGA